MLPSYRDAGSMGQVTRPRPDDAHVGLLSYLVLVLAEALILYWSTHRPTILTCSYHSVVIVWVYALPDTFLRVYFHRYRRTAAVIAHQKLARLDPDGRQ